MVARLDQYTYYDDATSTWMYGKPKDESTADALDGTEFKALMISDLYGPIYALLNAAGLTPSGSADTPMASQVLAAIANLQYSALVDYQTGSKVRYGTTWYVCQSANGPSSTVSTPGTSTVYWKSEAEDEFDRAYPVKCVRESTEKEFWLNIVGGESTTWELYGEGRMTMGYSATAVTDDSGFTLTPNTIGATAGEFKHKQTGAEVGSHSHPLDDHILTEDVSGSSFGGGTDGISGPPPDTDVNQETADVTAMNNLPPYIVVYRYRRTA